MSEHPTVLVTGASGFVGRALSLHLRATGDYKLVTASRSRASIIDGVPHRHHELLDLQQIPQLKDIDVVVHTAARVHVMNDQNPDKASAYREANVVGTVALANVAAHAGVKRFIYLSSIKVNGEQTLAGLPFTAFDTPHPQDPYGASKLEAELALREIESRTDMEVVVVRPTLVYGPGVKANFRAMMSWLAKGIPLPLGAIDNRRSLVALDNLVDLLTCCIGAGAAAGETFLVSDNEDLSTTQLLGHLARTLGSPFSLFPVPALILRVAGYAIGKGNVAQRLCGSLQVDISHTRETLDWLPPVRVIDALQATAAAYRAEKAAMAQYP